MKQLKLDVSLRDTTGTSANNRLRKSGKIPAVVYGISGNRNLLIKERDFRMLMRATSGAAALVEIAYDQGNRILSVIEDIQRNPYTDRFIHVDFHEVSPDEKMHATLPVRVAGEAYGVRNENGVLSVAIHSVDVRCLPKDLPEFITVDVTELKVGESVHVEELDKIPGVDFLEDAEVVIVACSIPDKIADNGAESDSTEGTEGVESKDASPSKKGEKKTEEGK